MRSAAKGLLLTLGLVLVGLAATPAQARFFAGFGYPGFYGPYPVYYRPYLLPAPPPPAVYVAPPPVIYREPVIYRSAYYRYSGSIVRRHRHRVVHRRFCNCRLG